MDEVAALMTEVTGNPWKYEPKEPREFFDLVVRFGADPIYMSCVRNVLERTSNGSLPEISDVFDTVSRVGGRTPISLRQFIQRNTDHFMRSSIQARRLTVDVQQSS